GAAGGVGGGPVVTAVGAVGTRADRTRVRRTLSGDLGGAPSGRLRPDPGVRRRRTGARPPAAASGHPTPSAPHHSTDPAPGGTGGPGGAGGPTARGGRPGGYGPGPGRLRRQRPSRAGTDHAGAADRTAPPGRAVVAVGGDPRRHPGGHLLCQRRGSGEYPRGG